MSIIQPLRRTLRPAAKTAQAMLRWKRLAFGDTPPMFGNAKPKSGSHLLLQVLSGMTQLMPYTYVRADPIRTISPQGQRKTSIEVAESLQKIPARVIGWGYVDPTPENISVLCQSGRVNYFVFRDPRDLLVSQVFFATDMHEDHGMHAFYKSLPDFGERLKVAITGIDRHGFYMVDVCQRYASVFQWLEQEHVLCVRFEDLVDRPEPTLNEMLDEVARAGYEISIPREKALAILMNAIQPDKSRTFRSGKTGGWREHFTPEHKQLFNEVAGDLLIRLGYEQDNNW